MRQNRRFYGCARQHVLAIFLVSVVLNYVWEIAQAPLYTSMEGWDNIWWHCFVASLGDGILVSIIYALGSAAFRRSDWHLYPSVQAYGLMLAIGLCIGLGVEWVAVDVFNRWTYTTGMPLIPGLGVGLVPVLQMLLLPPLIFRIAASWARHE